MSAFFWRIAILVSKSGGCISVISPHSNRDLKRSSSVGIFGGRSLEMTNCLLASGALMYEKFCVLLYLR